MRQAAGVAAVYVAAAVLLTWPLAASPATRLGALEGPGDPYLNLWTLGWGMQAWLSDPWGTLGGRAFDAPIFHPAGLTLTYSDHQLLQSLIAAPVFAATGQLTLAYNLVLLGSLAASGMAMHVLARAVSGSSAAAFVAGLAWACWPYRTAHLLHLQLQALYFLPLAVWALTRVAARRRWRDAGLLGVFAGLQAVASVYYGVMTAVTLAVAALLFAWTTGLWRNTRYWTRVGGAAVLAGAIVAPVAAVYLQSQSVEGFGRSSYEAANHSAAAQSYLQVPPDNAIYGRTGLLAPRPPAAGERDRRHVEHQMFPGLVVSLLALWGLWAGWRSDARAITSAFAGLALVGVWLSLGPDGPAGLYRYVAAHVFGFDAIRAPARFAVVAALGWFGLAAVGVARLPARAGPPARAGLVAALLMLGEYANAPLAWVPAPPVDTPVGRWLRAAEGPGAVAYLPVGHDRENTPFMLEALQHGRPIVNGYSGQRPLFYGAIVDSLAELPGVEGRAMLKELGVRFVVSPVRLMPGDADHPFVERADLDGRIVYELVWTAASERALVLAAEPPAPPGPVPFGPGEEAHYAVRWIGDVPAGALALRVDTPDAGDRARFPTVRWRFEASATTADWVSGFFEAHDVFATLAAPDLMPLLHRRDISEGSRSLSRAYVYDAARQQVRVAPTVDDALASKAPATPWSGQARDAVSALYYVRTLPLEEGVDYQVPVNDAGRHVQVRLQVEGLETLALPDGPVAALRIRVAIERRVERREPLDAVLWLSRDARRVPLRLDLSAGFGQVRAELVDYRQ